MKRLSRLLLAGLLTVCLSACSIIEWAYNNAPSFVADELDDAFDLDSDQMQTLEDRLDEFFAWHREQELMRYQAVLERASSEMVDGITAVEVLWLMDELRAARHRTVTRALDDFGELAASLSDEQIDHFAEHLHERADESREYLEKTPEQRRTFRVERNLDRLQDWFGDFDRELESRVQQRLADLPDTYESWYIYRDARQAAVLAALRGDGDGAAHKIRLQRALLDKNTDFARDFEARRKAYWGAYATALADISSWLSPRQHRAAADRLESYEDILVSLQSSGTISQSRLNSPFSRK